MRGPVSGLLLSALTVAAFGLDWLQTTSLPRNSSRHACAEANGFIYFIGGGTGPESDCWFSRVNPDGSIGTWQPETSLPAYRWAADGLAVNSRIYVPGGWLNEPILKSITLRS